MQVDIEILQALQDKPLIRLLVAVEKYGGDGISTRRLLESFNGNDLHSKLVEASARGFVKRNRVKPEEGKKGNWRMICLLSPKGRRLLQVAKQVQPFRERSE